MKQTAYSWNDYRSYALYHHGIKGQKWGVRRYQNLDGSLTEEGRKRQRIINQTESSKRVGKVVGGVVGGAAGVGASAAITLTTGFIVPYLQASITVGAATGGAKAVESIMQKIGDKRLADFDKKASKATAKNSKDDTKSENKTESSGNGYSKADKKRLLKDARENDMYDLEFLEATQNVEEPWSNKKRVEEYSKYLDDPEKYWKNRPQS